VIRRIEWLVLALILAAYLVIAALYAIRTPDWQAPDEPAHYNYVRQIADESELPVLEMGDWQQDYQNQLTATDFDPALLDRLHTVEYEDHQPPLYYLLQAPIYAISDGDLTPMRWLSVVLGAGVVLTTWAALRILLPRWPTVALTGAAFVAFLPQHLAILSSVSNDALAELFVGLTLLAVIAYLGNGRPVSPVVLGLLVGAALLTKTTIYFLGGIAVLAVLLRWRHERWPRRIAARHLGAVVIPALLIGGIWWARNLEVYGGTDFTGLTRHEAITIGQPRTDEYIETVYGGSTRVYLENYLKTTFHSFWGQFGWMKLPMPGRVYTILLLLTTGVLIGVPLFAWKQHWPRTLSGSQRDALIALAATLILVIAAYILYNFDFVQFQGRYLYPALLPFALLVGVGLHGWIALAPNRFRALAWLPVAAMIGLAVFALYALENYIVPNLPRW
jgi:4-amino-4-deoxy-L-arabinose transferase-like glycosyltransferase